MADKMYVVWYANAILLRYGVFESISDIETFVGEPVAVWVSNGNKIKGGHSSYFHPGDQHNPQYPLKYAAVEISIHKTGDKIITTDFRDLTIPPTGQR